MTNELEKKFFNTFGIEPKKQCYYWDCPYSTGDVVKDTPMNERDCNSCKNPNKEIYPQITDRILLELICIKNKELISIVQVRGNNLEELKSYILQTWSHWYTYYSSLPVHKERADNFKRRIRALFEGDNNV